MPDKNNTVTIESLAYGGSGFGRCEGKAVFIPLTAPGDVVRFSAVREKKNYLDGEILKVVAASPLRREPPCPAFGQCGGCSWQHLPYLTQSLEKDGIFRETLWRLGTVGKEKIRPIIPAPAEWNYRNRAQFKAIFIEGRLHLGFYRRKSHFIIDLAGCPLVSPLINRMIVRLKSILSTAPFRDRMPQVDIAVNDLDNAAVVILHFAASPSEKDWAFARNELSGIPELEGLFFQSGRKNTLAAVYSKEDGLLSYRLSFKESDMDLFFSPGGFTQVNYAQNRVLVSKAVECAIEHGVREALDLYCGIGNFALPLSRICNGVVAVEEYAKAIEDGKNNAIKASITNCTFIEGDAVRVIQRLNMRNFDMVLLDPPREGAAAAVKAIVRAGVPLVVYVSCNPTTLARDLRLMTREGYEVLSSQPIDLFPQTYHIESITVARRG